MNKERYIDKDWLEIANFYKELSVPKRETFQALARLCGAISASHLGAQLYAHTSVTSLCISQTRIPVSSFRPVKCETLNISPINKTELLFERGHWKRRVAARNLLPCFNKFLRQLGWNYHPIEDGMPTSC